MLDMNIPNPLDWITQTGAAKVLGVHPRTVHRMIVDGYLGVYWPRGGDRELRPKLFWYPEVLELRDARIRSGKQLP